MAVVNDIIIATAERSREISRWEDKGILRKLAPRLYTADLVSEPEKIIRKNWFRVVSGLYPEAFLSHRSALENRPTPGGHLYLTRPFVGLVELPGLTLHFIKGPAATDSDKQFFENLRISGQARAFLENFERTRVTGETSKTLSREQLEEKVESVLRTKGEAGLNQLRDEARKIAPVLGKEKEFESFNKLVTDILGTGFSKNLMSHAARLRVMGDPLDPDRIQLFEYLYEALVSRDYPEIIDYNKTTKSYQNFAFFESYFSNYIEGTEFTVEEAKQIINTEMPIPTRDEDSHDVLGTYQIVSDRSEMSVLPASPDELLKVLQSRHGVLLSARTSKKPGEFKDKNNRAGSTEFVDLNLVRGTLKKSYDWYSLLQHPFAKAAYMMFIVSEVHPFLDGNGRIARVMMNAELSARGLSKIIIPTVFRDDYMGTLKKMTKQRDADSYIRMLIRAWEFSATVHTESLDEMEAYLEKCNAFLKSNEGYLKY